MKPLILDFLELCNEPELDYSNIEYSDDQNLNVLKDTNSPAILLTSFDPVTVTRTYNETSDIAQTMRAALDTMTGTFTHNEASDPDNSLRLATHLDTMTGTKTYNEVPDDDANYKSLYKLLDTATSTATQNPDFETTDTDRDIQ